MQDRKRGVIQQVTGLPRIVLPGDAERIDRRAFVRTAGGLFVSASMGCGGAEGPTGTATGSVQVNITGLAPGALSGGTVTITQAGAAPLTVPIPPGGGTKDGIPVGVYTVSYKPPDGYIVSPGTSVPTSVTIVADQTKIIDISLTVSPFQTPNIVINASFEADFEGFTNWSAGTPTGVSRDTTRAFDGTTAIKKVLPVTGGSDIGSQFVHNALPGFDRLWVRFYFYLDSAVDGTLKFNIWFDQSFNTQFGGLFLETGRLSAFIVDTAGSGFARLKQVSTLVNAWHSLELDYWRNGDTANGGNDYPSMAIYLDGTQITDSLIPLPSPMSWINGRLNFGGRTSSAKLGICELLGLLNGTPANTVPGNIWVDKVALSSLGRIGP